MLAHGQADRQEVPEPKPGSAKAKAASDDVKGRGEGRTRRGGGGEISELGARRRSRPYLSFERDIQRIQPHQYLALCRAETAGWFA